MSNNLSNDQKPASANDTAAATDGIKLQLNYRAPSQVTTSAQASLTQAQASEQTKHVALFAQLNRDDVRFHASIKAPIVFRDTLLALFDVVSSDYRYVPKDRSAYTVFMQMRRSNANKNLFAAQRDYFTWLFNNDPLAFCILDPIIQVHQDGVSFEVFSRDEGCYAQLTLTNDIFEPTDSHVLGTTSIDYSTALYEGINQIRDYQQTVLDIGHDAVSLIPNLEISTSRKTSASANATQSNAQLEADTQSNETSDESSSAQDNQVIEKRINVPKSWIRALLQVQSAGQLATDTLQLDPIALYNVLFELRMHADVKGKRRGLLIELQPQQAPVIILEPFNITVTNQLSKSRFVYQGKHAKIIRLWGRRRLSLLKRLLPHTDHVSVSLLGQGMPSYWTLSGKGFHFNFAMTGFSQANWSQSLNFDLLLPKRPEHTHTDDLQPLLEHLQATPSSIDALVMKKDAQVKSTARTELTAQLIDAAQQGFVRYDIATHTYYYRPLTQTPLDMAQFAHHNDAEKQAYDLVARKKAVQKFTVENIATKGIVIQGDIEVVEDRRTYHSQLQLNEEGMVGKAECSCPQYLQHRLTQGVCAHLITLRLAYNAYDSSEDSLREGSWHETRVLSKRISTKTKAVEKSSGTSKNSISKNNILKNSIADSVDHSSLNLMDLSALSALAHEKSTYATAITNVSSAAANTTQMAMTYITIEHKKVRIEQVVNEKTTRQQFVFNQPNQAFAAYQQYIARFEAKGFIENQGV